jgi:hypothetical protein
MRCPQVIDDHVEIAGALLPALGHGLRLDQPHAAMRLTDLVSQHTIVSACS